MIGVAADVSIEEAKLIIRRLQLDAYYCLVNAFRASGYLTKTKLRILQELSLYFQLSTERHQAEIRRAVNDEELTALADLVTKDDSSYEWICEGRHPVPVHDDDFSYKLPRYSKLRKDVVKTEKFKENKPANLNPTPPPQLIANKGTQTPNKELAANVDVSDVKQELKSPIDLLSGTPDILEMDKLENIVSGALDTLIVYLSYDTNKVDPVKDIPDLHVAPVVIPLRVDELFGKLILEQGKSVRDSTGHVQLPLDISKLTRDRLEKKPKQRRKPGGTVSAAAAVGDTNQPGGTAPAGPVKRRRKKSLTPALSPAIHNIPESGSETVTPLLTTPEPAGDLPVKKDIVKVGAPPGPPLLAKAPQYDIQSPNYHALQPPMLQRMPGVTVHSTISPVKGPSSATHYPTSVLSPSKIPHSQGLGTSPLRGTTPSVARFRCSEDLNTDPLRCNIPVSLESKPADLVTQEHRIRSIQQSDISKSWHSRSDVAWRELSLSEPNSIQVQRYQSQQKELTPESLLQTTSSGKGRKYLTTQDLTSPHHLLAHEQWLTDQLNSHVSGAQQKHSSKAATTPEKLQLQEAIKHEHQRIKMVEMEDKLRRTEDVEKRKDEERQRMEERLKQDEKLRAEEKRGAAQQYMRIEEKHKSQQVGGTKEDSAKFGKHDPTTSYLSTYLPTNKNTGKVQGARAGVSKLSRNKGGKQIPVIEGEAGKHPDNMTSKMDSPKASIRVETNPGMRVEPVSNSIRVESVSNSGQKLSITTSELGSGVRQYIVEKNDDRTTPKPTIQILTQPTKSEPDHKKSDPLKPSSSFANYQQNMGNIMYSSSGSKSTTGTAPTICVKTTKPTMSASSSSTPKSYMPYPAGKVTQENLANLYTQQMLQQQLAMMQLPQQSQIRSGMTLYATKSSSGKEPKMSQQMVDVGDLLQQQQHHQKELLQQKELQNQKELREKETQKKEQSVADKILSDQQRQITEKQRDQQRQLSEQQHRQMSDHQRHISEQQRQVIFQQATAGYRLSPGGQVVVGKFPGTTFDHLAQAQQYQIALAAANQPTKSRSSLDPARKLPKQPSYSLPPGKPFGQYMQAQLTKPHQTPTDSRARKSGAPEDVFKFPDDDEERNNLRRIEDRQKQMSGDRMRTIDPDRHKLDRHMPVSADTDKHMDRERQLSYQQKQQLHSKMVHEKQMMEQRALHDRKVEEDIRRFNEEISKHIQMVNTEHEDKRSVEVQHYITSTENRAYHPTSHLTITTPHLTIPSSSSHLTTSGIIITHPHGTLHESVDEMSKQRKRKLMGQDHINSLLKNALSLLQKTLKLRPKTRVVNPSYPPHIWHQQSMDPKFIEKGLTPVDLMTVKKKLEFGEYSSFESFYTDVTHFQRNYSEVYPADHQLRQEIDEIMGVFLKELKEIYRTHTPHQSPIMSQKKPKADGM